jgi:hypothetical protein
LYAFKTSPLLWCLEQDHRAAIEAALGVELGKDEEEEEEEQPQGIRIADFSAYVLPLLS